MIFACQKLGMMGGDDDEVWGTGRNVVVCRGGGNAINSDRGDLNVIFICFGVLSEVLMRGTKFPQKYVPDF